MPKLTNASQIWTLTPTVSHRRTAAKYASRTLPWTFNRMMKNTSARGQNERGLNIAKGIVAQEVLKAELERQGTTVRIQRKSHRDEDLFDFHLMKAGRLTKFDVKSIAYYNDYPNDQRPPFTTRLLIENKSYPGPDWRKFFPMLVAHTQIFQQKDGYIFLISESSDFRRSVLDGRDDDLIVAYPSGESMPFYTYKRLCMAREDAGKGFFITLELRTSGLFNGDNLEVNVLYEWAGKPKVEQCRLRAGQPSSVIGPMSVLNCLQLSRTSYIALGNQLLLMRLRRNEFNGFVPNSQHRNMNVVPKDEAQGYLQEDFCNLILPSDYKVHCLGWLEKEEFIETVKKYPAWIWPIDAQDRFKNTPWSQVTAGDQRLLQKLGMEDRISRNPGRINAGLMKTSGRGPGACCYVFPNIFGTGLRETNLYVLPQDLETMDSLK